MPAFLRLVEYITCGRISIDTSLDIHTIPASCSSRSRRCVISPCVFTQSDNCVVCVDLKNSTPNMPRGE